MAAQPLGGQAPPDLEPAGQPCYRPKCKCCSRWRGAVETWAMNVRAHERQRSARRFGLWWRRCAPGCMVCLLTAGKLTR